MNSGVYKIYFLDTHNKVYIGSSKILEARKKQHLMKLRGNKHINPLLQHAFNKYGENKFVFEVIEEVEIKRLIEREKFHYCEAIDNDLVVYNILIPDKSPINTGRTRFKKGQSSWNKGKVGVYSEVTKLKMAQAKEGKMIGNTYGFKKCQIPWNKGLKMTTEHCQKLSEAHKNQIPWFKKINVPPPVNTGRTRFKLKAIQTI